MELHAFESVCVCVCLCAAGTASCFIITLFPCLTHWAIFTPQSSRSPLDDSRVLVQLACSCTLNLRISTEMHVLLKKLTDLLYLCCYGVCLHRLYVCVCVCVFVCLCACVMCLLGRQWTAACGLCLCIWQQLAPLSLSCLDSLWALLLILWLTEQWPFIWRTHNATFTYDAYLFLGVRGTRCDASHAHACDT